MKKFTIFFSIIVFIMSFTACSFQHEKEETETLTSVIPSEQTDDEMSDPEETFVKDSGGADITPRKYRTRYYSVAYQFVELVGVDNYWEWSDVYNTENPDKTNEMVIKKFVQYFNISREDFDKANLAFGKVLSEGVDISLCLNPKDYADQEIYEIYNADIIYTFNDEIINEYYLTPEYSFGWKIEYLNALESCKYQTQTVDWIDIEQMEAEIIAKYGEAEFVTEETTVIPEATSTKE